MLVSPPLVNHSTRGNKFPLNVKEFNLLIENHLVPSKVLRLPVICMPPLVVQLLQSTRYEFNAFGNAISLIVNNRN